MSISSVNPCSSEGLPAAVWTSPEAWARVAPCQK